MNTQQFRIGFNQKVRLEWMHYAAAMLLDGRDALSIKNELDAYLADKVAKGSSSKRSARSKVISIIRNVWVSPRDALVPLRNEGLEILATTHQQPFPDATMLAVHWGMTCASYPFWASIAIQTGRLFRIQNTASIAEVQRRLREQYGERETVSCAVSRVLRSFREWGVLQDASAKRVYTAGNPMEITSPRVIAWMLEASLHAQQKDASSLRTLLQHPVFFPFMLDAVYPAEIEASAMRLEIHRHSLDDDLVVLRK
mgnify:FL=1